MSYTFRSSGKSPFLKIGLMSFVTGPGSLLLGTPLVKVFRTRWRNLMRMWSQTYNRRIAFPRSTVRIRRERMASAKPTVTDIVARESRQGAGSASCQPER